MMYKLIKTETFEKQFKELSNFPCIGKEFESSILKGYKVLISKKNLLIYKVDEENNIIILYLIVSANQNYLNLLK